MSLIESVEHNDIQAVKGLIAGGTDVNAEVDAFGGTALWYAAEGGHVECVIALLGANAVVHNIDNDYDTPLHMASSNGHAECVRVLIQHKANVDALNTNGSSPLHYASMHGHLACIQILVASGAERNRPDNGGDTPLADAIIFNRLNVAQFLLYSGAKVKNVQPDIEIPEWMADVITKRRIIMSFTLALKGVLKRRLGLSKDVTNLIALYFWSERLK